MKKVHKRKKVSRQHGRKMGTHGTGARKNKRGSGMSGGKGMSGSGKRADHKKTRITKLFGHTYFGKKGVTSRGSKRDTRKRINLQQIELNIEKYPKKGDSFEVDLSSYKILGQGDVKNKLIIKAKEASKSAIEKVKKAGGEIKLPVKKVEKQIEEKKEVSEKSEPKEEVVEKTAETQ